MSSVIASNDETQTQLCTNFINITKIRDKSLDQFFGSLDIMLDEYNLRGITDLNFILNEITEYRALLKNELILINIQYIKTLETITENNYKNSYQSFTFNGDSIDTIPSININNIVNLHDTPSQGGCSIPIVDQIKVSDLNYILTKDHYFSVNITFPIKNDNILEKIKYIFTFLMCGKKGKELFPDEPKHSLATTYPLSAGLYTIKYVDNHPTLYGLLRYKHVIKHSALTIKKIKKLGMCHDIRKSPIINANIPALWEDNKHHYCVNDMTNIINNIISTPYYGSDIKLFFNHDD